MKKQIPPNRGICYMNFGRTRHIFFIYWIAAGALPPRNDKGIMNCPVDGRRELGWVIYPSLD